MEAAEQRGKGRVKACLPSGRTLRRLLHRSLQGPVMLKMRPWCWDGEKAGVLSARVPEARMTTDFTKLCSTITSDGKCLKKKPTGIFQGSYLCSPTPTPAPTAVSGNHAVDFGSSAICLSQLRSRRTSITLGSALAPGIPQHFPSSRSPGQAALPRGWACPR